MTKVLVATEKPFATAAVDQIKNIFNDAGYDCTFLKNIIVRMNSLQL